MKAKASQPEKWIRVFEVRGSTVVFRPKAVDLLRRQADHTYRLSPEEDKAGASCFGCGSPLWNGSEAYRYDEFDSRSGQVKEYLFCPTCYELPDEEGEFVGVTLVHIKIWWNRLPVRERQSMQKELGLRACSLWEELSRTDRSRLQNFWKE